MMNEYANGEDRLVTNQQYLHLSTPEARLTVQAHHDLTFIFARFQSLQFAGGSRPSNTTRWMYQKCACVFPTTDWIAVCQHV
jgi:hypothetical protein